MGIFASATQIDAIAVAVAPQAAVTMQTVHDETEDPTEKKRVARIGEFFGAPLSTLDEEDLLKWFDDHFPSLKEIGAGPLPGVDRDFWETRAAYGKWREVARRRVKITTGVVAAQQALRARIDGFSALLATLEELAKDNGLVHPGQIACIRAFVDRARARGLDVIDLTPDHVHALLDELAWHDREASARALRALGTLLRVRQIAAHLPDGYDASSLVPEMRTPVPDHVRAMIAQMVKVARYKDGLHDDITKTTSEAFNLKTALTYGSALIALARAAAEAELVNLTTLTSFKPLFASDVRRAAIARWTDLEALDQGFSARTAANYVRVIAQIGKANGIKTKKWSKSLKANDFLQEGQASATKMSPKNQRFCERLIHHPSDVRTFLRQHVLYQDRANDILATDKPLSIAALRNARRLGSCAAFAALEIRGAGIRKGSALASHAAGTDQNLFRRESGGKRWFELRIAREDMKGEYVEMPPIPIRDDKYCGYEVLNWYLETIRPLFDFANPEWCEEQKCAQTPFLFPSEQSAQALRGSLLYRWVTRSSADIGLAMSPHNYRHGFATLLLARSWSNRGRAAAYLGCSVQVLDTYYAWIDRQQKLEETQDLLAEALAG